MIDEAKITELATASFEAHQTYLALGMMNADRPYAEARQLAIDYALAQAKATEARHLLDAAIAGQQ